MLLRARRKETLLAGWLDERENLAMTHKAKSQFSFLFFLANFIDFHLIVNEVETAERMREVISLLMLCVCVFGRDQGHSNFVCFFVFSFAA